MRKICYLWIRLNLCFVKKIFLILLFAVSAVSQSCKSDGVIPPEDMSALLAEMYILDGCIELADSRPEGLDSLEIYAPLIESRGFTKELFRHSIEHYLRHPSDFSKIYSRVQKELEAKGHSVDMYEVEETGELEEKPEGADVEEGKDAASELAPAPDSGENKQVQKEDRNRSARRKMTKKELKELEKRLK